MDPTIDKALKEDWTVARLLGSFLRLDTSQRTEEEIRESYGRAIAEAETKHARILALWDRYDEEGLRLEKREPNYAAARAGYDLKNEKLALLREWRAEANAGRERLNAMRALVAEWDPIPFLDGGDPKERVLEALARGPCDRLIELHDQTIARLVATPPVAYYTACRDEAADTIERLKHELEKEIERNDEERDWRRRMAATLENLEVPL